MLKPSGMICKLLSPGDRAGSFQASLWHQLPELLLFSCLLRGSMRTRGESDLGWPRGDQQGVGSAAVVLKFGTHQSHLEN